MIVVTGKKIRKAVELNSILPSRGQLSHQHSQLHQKTANRLLNLYFENDCTIIKKVCQRIVIWRQDEKKRDYQ